MSLVVHRFRFNILSRLRFVGRYLRPRERSALARLLPPEDHAILAMRLAATPRREISDTLRIDGRAMRRRLTAIVARLQAGAVEAVSAPPRSPQAT